MQNNPHTQKTGCHVGGSFPDFSSGLRPARSRQAKHLTGKTQLKNNKIKINNMKKYTTILFLIPSLARICNA